MSHHFCIFLIKNYRNSLLLCTLNVSIDIYSQVKGIRSLVYNLIRPMMSPSKPITVKHSNKRSMFTRSNAALKFLLAKRALVCQVKIRNQKPCVL